MKLGNLGVFAFTDILDSKELARTASRLEELGYATLWYPEALALEPFALGAYLLSHTKNMIIASGIANIYARDATASVMGVNTLNALYDGRFLLGLGVSHAPLVSDLRGHAYSDKPVATMRAYLDDMDRAWEALGGAPAEKQVILAALGPNMLKLGAERTLGVMPANVTAAHAKQSRELIGSKPLICSEVYVCLTEDADQARAAARAALDFYLPLENYLNSWKRLGFDTSDFADGGSDRFIDALVGWGNLDQIKARIGENLDNGANQAVLYPIRPDGQPGLDWAALEALAPGRA